MHFKSIMLAAAALLAAPALGAAPTPAPAQPPAVAPAIDVETARNAVAHTDFNRLIGDRAYAGQMLAYLDRLAAVTQSDADASLNIDMLRLFALATLERGDEIRTVVDRMLERRPREAHLYGGPLYATLAITDIARAVAVVETASRNVPASGWAELRGLFDRDSMQPLLARLHADHEEAARVRLAQALFHIGWPGGGDAESTDFLRSILIDDRIAHNDGAAAADYAAGITTPATMLPMILRTRYDTVLGAGADRVALLRHALDERDRATAAAVAAAPRDMQKVLERAQYLRGLGRDAEAYALLEPFTRDVRATVAAGEQGMWLINDAAYALSTLGRHPEAMRLMERLSALPLESNGALISALINRSDILRAAGRSADALAWAQRLDRDSSRFASDYGKMWIASTIVCALAELNRNGEAAPQLERLRAAADANPAALTQAYLCIGDSDAAAALIVHRLESDDPESAILALQDYSVTGNEGRSGQLLDRLQALRERPAVRDALGRVGRVVTLPLARSYWASF